MQTSDNLRGILAMCAAMTAFSANDAVVKSAAASLPLGEIMAVRGVFATAFLAVACLLSGAWRDLAALASPAVALRVFGEIGATIFYLLGLIHLPFNTAAAVFQVTPLAVTAGAALFLGERVRWRRWTAIAVGFSGALVIIRPAGGSFEPAAGYVLASVVFVVIRDLVTARIPADVPTFGLAGATALAMTLVGALFASVDVGLGIAGWRPIAAPLLALLALGAALLVCGYVLIIVAMRTGELSVVAPFRYSVVIAAFLLGALVFGESLDRWMIVGTALIVGSGLYTFYREQTLKKRPVDVLPAEAAAPRS